MLQLLTFGQQDRSSTFSPLFIGARNVTHAGYRGRGAPFRLSVPFSSGQGMLPLLENMGFQVFKAFSPLFIGARNVTS